MKRQIILAAVVLSAGGAHFALAQGSNATDPAVPATQSAATPKSDADVPIKRIVLFSSGVGYFEHAGSVDGNAAAALKFETAQINDVLKSLCVFDRDGGSVRNITYPANDPVNRTLRSFQVNLSGDPSMADILKQMRGAEVSITVADETVTGKILGVEQKERAVGPAGSEKITHPWVVNLITDDGIRSLSLDDVRKLSVLDDKIKKEMNQALAALVQARDQTKKVMTINFEGTGRRRVGMGYLVETPIWKATYRLLLPDAASKDSAELQGWAIVENQTDNDWVDVNLSLVGGRPLGFIEMLYQPLYASRPVIMPSIAGNIMPQTYENGISSLGGIAASNAPTFNLQSLSNQSQNGLFSNNGGQVQSVGGGFGGGGGGSAPAGGIAGEAPSDYMQGVAAVAEAAKIGEMFHYTVDKVSLPRQQSSMLPIIAEGVPVKRVSIYNQSVLSKYATRGVRLSNNTGKYLLGGPVTVMDTLKEGASYAGDAKIEDVPPGQSRLLSYAVDQDLLIVPADEIGDETLISGSIVKGMLWIRYRSQVQHEYAIQNKSDEAKTLIFEHPVVNGYDLKQPEKAAEKTDRVYRFELPITAKETTKFKVVLERTRIEEMAILTLKDDALALYVKQGAISDKVREALSSVAAKRADLADLERKKTLKDQDRAQILQEQANIRDNIRVLPAGGKSQEDAIHDLGAKDQELKDANQQIKDMQKQIDDGRAALDKYLAGLSLD